MSKKSTTEEFIEKAKAVHGGKYDYSQVKYVNSGTKVTIVCPFHSTFTQKPRGHLTGRGCLKCKHEYGKDTLEDFIVKARAVYGDKYDYSKSVYTKSKAPIEIQCRYHDIYKTTPTQHLKSFNKHACPKCRKEAEMVENGEAFVQRSKALYGDKFTYTNTLYAGSHKEVIVTCDIHGDVIVPVSRHFSSLTGCPLCNRKAQSERCTLTLEEFLIKAKEVHGDKYRYSTSVYKSAKSVTSIFCNKHKEYFEQTPDNHVRAKAGCPRCGKNLSKAEDTIVSHTESLNLHPQQSNRSLIAPFELDIVVPSKKVAIEYNGLRWHSEKFGKDKHYHKNKTDLCKAQGYRLIHIWEDDFTKDPQKELDFLSYALGVSTQKKVYARKTSIREVTSKEGRAFLDEYHIQGSGTGSRYYGTYHLDELVAVTSFLIKKGIVELTRHASDRQILGGLGKVTKHASKALKKDILSFCDLSRFDGNSYISCGFEVDKEIPPDYKYIVGNERQHKFIWRKKSIATKLPDIYDPDLTEKEMMELADIPRIWDCGKLRLIYKYKQVGVQDIYKLP